MKLVIAFLLFNTSLFSNVTDDMLDWCTLQVIRTVSVIKFSSEVNAGFTAIRRCLTLHSCYSLYPLESSIERYPVAKRQVFLHSWPANKSVSSLEEGLHYFLIGTNDEGQKYIVSDPYSTHSDIYQYLISRDPSMRILTAGYLVVTNGRLSVVATNHSNVFRKGNRRNHLFGARLISLVLGAKPLVLDYSDSKNTSRMVELGIFSFHNRAINDPSRYVALRLKYRSDPRVSKLNELMRKMYLKFPDDKVIPGGFDDEKIEDLTMKVNEYLTTSNDRTKFFEGSFLFSTMRTEGPEFVLDWNIEKDSVAVIEFYVNHLVGE